MKVNVYEKGFYEDNSENYSIEDIINEIKKYDKEDVIINVEVVFDDHICKLYAMNSDEARKMLIDKYCLYNDKNINSKMIKDYTINIYRKEPVKDSNTSKDKPLDNSIVKIDFDELLNDRDIDGESYVRVHSFLRGTNIVGPKEIRSDDIIYASDMEDLSYILLKKCRKSNESCYYKDNKFVIDKIIKITDIDSVYDIINDIISAFKHTNLLGRGKEIVDFYQINPTSSARAAYSRFGEDANSVISVFNRLNKKAKDIVFGKLTIDDIIKNITFHDSMKVYMTIYYIENKTSNACKEYNCTFCNEDQLKDCIDHFKKTVGDNLVEISNFFVNYTSEEDKKLIDIRNKFMNIIINIADTDIPDKITETKFNNIIEDTFKAIHKQFPTKIYYPKISCTKDKFGNKHYDIRKYYDVKDE